MATSWYLGKRSHAGERWADQSSLIYQVDDIGQNGQVSFHLICKMGLLKGVICKVMWSLNVDKVPGIKSLLITLWSRTSSAFLSTSVSSVSQYYLQLRLRVCLYLCSPKLLLLVHTPIWILEVWLLWNRNFNFYVTNHLNDNGYLEILHTHTHRVDDGDNPSP